MIEDLKVKLTQFSHGYGCGCKIAPQVLDIILKGNETKTPFPGLLVGNDSRDDAAVMDMGNGIGLISTTDFFMPIVDDPYYFGRIAATNAISDVYAMGGTPSMAVAILGWPIDKLAPEIAAAAQGPRGRTPHRWRAHQVAGDPQHAGGEDALGRPPSDGHRARRRYHRRCHDRLRPLAQAWGSTHSSTQHLARRGRQQRGRQRRG